MSEGVPATFYDGRTSQPRPVLLRFAGDGTLTVSDARGAAGPQVFQRREVRVESRLGDAPRFVRLPGDARCEVGDNDALDEALAAWSAPGLAAMLHRVEQSWRLVVLSAAVLLAAGWLAIAHGVPWGAKRVAFMLPERLIHSLGDETLAAFDRTVFNPSTLDEERRAALGGAIPAFLLQSRFSREFETESDAYAIASMQRAGVPTRHLADMLEKLEAAHRQKADEAAVEEGKEGGVMDYISTHPPTRERVRAIREADGGE